MTLSFLQPKADPVHDWTRDGIVGSCNVRGEPPGPRAGSSIVTADNVARPVMGQGAPQTRNTVRERSLVLRRHAAARVLLESIVRTLPRELVLEPDLLRRGEILRTIE